MPNVKIYVDRALPEATAEKAETLLRQIRDALKAGLGVSDAACHIVLLEVGSLPGQTPVNIELCLLRQPARSRETVAQVCGQLRDLAAGVLKAPSAIRCTLADPETYIVIRAG